MATRVDAETALGMLSDIIDTEPESEDSMYDGIDSEDSVSSREMCDDGFDNDEENNSDDENDDNLADSSDESEEEPVDSTGTRGKGRGAVRGRGRGTLRGRGTGSGSWSKERGGSGRRGGARGGKKQTLEELYKWMVVEEGGCGSKQN